MCRLSLIYKNCSALKEKNNEQSKLLFAICIGDMHAYNTYSEVVLKSIVYYTCTYEYFSFIVSRYIHTIMHIPMSPLTYYCVGKMTTRLNYTSDSVELKTK